MEKTSGVLCGSPLRGKEKQVLKKIVITGGPCAGKTEVMERLKVKFGSQAVFVPEAAVWYFRRHGRMSNPAPEQEMTAQRGIFEVNKEFLKKGVEEAKLSNLNLVIVDRATVDVKAYWPAGAERFFEDMGTTEEAEFGNYDFVIFMRSAAGTKYYQQNDIRNENSALAAELDAGVFRAWSGHSNLIEIKFNENFEDKMNEVAAVINGIVESL